MALIIDINRHYLIDMHRQYTRATTRLPLLVSVLEFVVPLVEIYVEDDQTTRGQTRHEISETEMKVKVKPKIVKKPKLKQKNW